jgi:transglutaminase-like putative cysteine protease
MQFIDHRTINWREVRRVRCLFYQRFQYQYPGPIYNLKQRLVVIPTQQYGTQHLRDHHLSVNPPPAAIRESADAFGNRILELDLPAADRSVLFETFMIVENESHPTTATAAVSPISTAEADYWLKPTYLTMPDDHITALAQSLKREASTAHDLAQRISDRVYQIMRYQNRVTSVETTAAEALALGQGLCQDYAHLMLSLCRSAALPARYVSGHMLGDGGSHAWVEVFLPGEVFSPGEPGLIATAFDPTNNRRPDLDYITVAVGRDYRDVSPTSGSFTASYGGELTFGKQAGLIRVEYRNGDILESQPVI